MNILYFIMGLLLLSVYINILQKMLIDDLRNEVGRMNEEIMHLYRLLENYERSEKDLYD